MKKIEDYEGFDLLDPTFFDTLMTISHMTWDVSYKIIGEGYLARSGEKYPAPIMRKLYDKDPTNAKALLANVIIAKYESNWARLKAAILDTDYNPIENYNMNEKKIKDEQTTTFGKTVDDDDTITFGKKVDDDLTNSYGKKVETEDTTAVTKNGDIDSTHDITSDQTKITPGIETTIEGDVYGYNSSAEVPSDKRVESKTGFDTQDHELSESTKETYTDLKEEHSGSVEVTESGSDGNTRDYEESGEEKHEKDYREGGTEKVEHEYEFERTGNIGVTTSQQMLQSEIELRQWAWLDQVYADIDKVIALQTY